VLAVFTVGGENMRPRLKPSQRVEFDMAAYTSAAPKAGDIVVIAPPVGASRNRCRFPRNPGDRLCVKPFGGPEPQIRLITRVVAVGGDRIRFRRGRVERNGRLERRHRIRRCRPNACTYRRAITVPAGHVYVAGDNRPSSDDSRFWGAVPVAQVLGRYVRTLPPA
jgi:signal peptidase I